MNEGHSFIRQPENLSGDLMEVRCSHYFRTGGPAVDQMFYNTTKKSCAIWTGRVSNRHGEQQRRSAKRSKNGAWNNKPRDKRVNGWLLACRQGSFPKLVQNDQRSFSAVPQSKRDLIKINHKGRLLLREREPGQACLATEPRILSRRTLETDSRVWTRVKTDRASARCRYRCWRTNFCRLPQALRTRRERNYRT